MLAGLLEASEQESADNPVEQSSLFLSKSKRYERMMKEINTATTLLQAPNMSLADCCDILDALIAAVGEEQGDASSALYRCKLGTKYIGVDSTIIENKHFENGVVKVQRNQLQILSNAEK